MRLCGTLVCLVLSGCVWSAAFAQFNDTIFEFETLPQEADNQQWVWRSAAEQLKSLRLARGQRNSMTLTLCSSPLNRNRPVIAYIDNIRYSNDGPSDIVFVSVNGVRIASFNTVENWNWGNLWNTFLDTGNLGRRFSMVGGRYRLRIRARTDRFGIELDNIKIKTRNQDPAVPIICRARFNE